MDDSQELISSGNNHTCALRQSDGTAVCWGKIDDLEPNPPVGEQFASISAGHFHTCVLLSSDETEVCWGYDPYSESVRPPWGTQFAAISSGYYHTCAVSYWDGTAV